MLVTSVVTLLLSGAPDPCFTSLPTAVVLRERSETLLSAMRALTDLSRAALSGEAYAEYDRLVAAYSTTETSFARLANLEDLAFLARRHKVARGDAVMLIRAFARPAPFDAATKSLNLDLSGVKRASSVAEISRVRTVVEEMDRDLAVCARDPQ